MVEFKDLMRALTAEAGLDEEPKGDDDGIHRVSYRDEAVCFQEVPELHRLYISAKVGALPVEGADAFKTMMLKANFFGRDVSGGTLSLTNDEEVHFHTSLDMIGLEGPDDFLSELELVLTVLDTWRKKIADFRPDVADGTDSATDSGFLQV